MATPVTTYVTLPDVKAHLSLAPSDTNDDAVITSKITAASRAIDGLCRRRFWRDPVSPDPTSVRYYRAITDDYCEIDDLIVDADTVIATDDADQGTWATTLASTDWIGIPYNGVGPDRQPGWPVNAFEIVNLSISLNSFSKHPTVKVTGRWGWAAVPDAVKEACLIVTADLFHYKDVRSGTIGFNEFGPVVVRTAIAGHAKSLLAPYGGAGTYMVA